MLHYVNLHFLDIVKDGTLQESVYECKLNRFKQKNATHKLEICNDTAVRKRFPDVIVSCPIIFDLNILTKIVKNIVQSAFVQMINFWTISNTRLWCLCKYISWFSFDFNPYNNFSVHITKSVRKPQKRGFGSRKNKHIKPATLCSFHHKLIQYYIYFPHMHYLTLSFSLHKNLQHVLFSMIIQPKPFWCKISRLCKWYISTIHHNT